MGDSFFLPAMNVCVYHNNYNKENLHEDYEKSGNIKTIYQTLEN